MFALQPDQIGGNRTSFERGQNIPLARAARNAVQLCGNADACKGLALRPATCQIHNQGKPSPLAHAAWNAVQLGDNAASWKGFAMCSATNQVPNQEKPSPLAHAAWERDGVRVPLEVVERSYGEPPAALRNRGHARQSPSGMKTLRV